MLADSNNTVVLLPLAHVVAKVATSGLEGRGGDSLARELAVGRRLAERGAPAAAPVPGEAAGPHRVDDLVVTLWRHLEPQSRPAGGEPVLGAALCSFQEALAGLLEQLEGRTCLHGEPHAGNVIWTAGGPVLIDFEAACVGPLEWDLAYLPDRALDAFPQRDAELVERLRPGVSFCVAAWCHAGLERGEEMRRAADLHLDALRASRQAG